MQPSKNAGMMTLESPFLEGAIEVGNQLIRLAITDGRQIYWKTIDKTTKAVSYDQTTIYSGGSGIGLFFLELYKHTRQKKFLRTAQRAIRTAADKEKTMPPYSYFITGRLGVAFALLKLHEVTGNQSDLKQALALAQTCRQSTRDAHEYLSGNAGSALCLLHLHAATREPWLLEAANDYLGQILQGIRPATTGIYWDRNSHEIQPLCGFSHGVAGIGFAFLEFGRYLKNPAFYEVAKQALAYENAQFDRAMGNWPDFRLNMWTDEKIAAFEEAYKRGDQAVFTQAQNMVAWCHGGPGIGLSRIVAYRVTRNRIYLEDLNRALVTTKKAHTHDLTLCHGQAGNLETFIESYVALGRKRDWAYARTSGDSLLKALKEMCSRMKTDEAFAERQDPELLTGIAGIGYTLLRLHDPYLTPSILAPRLSKVLRTKPDANLQFLRIDHDNLQRILSGNNSAESPYIRQIKREMIPHYPSNGLLFIKTRVHGEMLRPLLQAADQELLKQNLQLDEDCHLRLLSPADAMFFRYTVQDIEQKSISQFCYVVLAAFKKPRNVQKAISTISEHYHATTPEQQALLHTKALEQIRQALYARLLLPSTSR